MKQFSREFSRRFLVFGALAGLGQLGLAGCSNGPDYFNGCAGPIADFGGDHSPGVTGDHATWKRIVLVTTRNPRGDIIVGYAGTHESDPAYSYSKPVAADRAGTLALKIGPGDVSFVVQYAARQDTALCHTPPESSFSTEQPLGNLPPDAVYPDWRR